MTTHGSTINIHFFKEFQIFHCLRIKKFNSIDLNVFCHLLLNLRNAINGGFVGVNNISLLVMSQLFSCL